MDTHAKNIFKIKDRGIAPTCNYEENILKTWPR